MTAGKDGTPVVESSRLRELRNKASVLSGLNVLSSIILIVDSI